MTFRHLLESGHGALVESPLGVLRADPVLETVAYVFLEHDGNSLDPGVRVFAYDADTGAYEELPGQTAAWGSTVDAEWLHLSAAGRPRVRAGAGIYEYTVVDPLDPAYTPGDEWTQLADLAFPPFDFTDEWDRWMPRTQHRGGSRIYFSKRTQVDRLIVWSLDVGSGTWIEERWIQWDEDAAETAPSGDPRFTAWPLNGFDYLRVVFESVSSSAKVHWKITMPGASPASGSHFEGVMDGAWSSVLPGGGLWPVEMLETSDGLIIYSERFADAVDGSRSWETGDFGGHQVPAAAFDTAASHPDGAFWYYGRPHDYPGNIRINVDPWSQEIDLGTTTAGFRGWLTQVGDHMAVRWSPTADGATRPGGIPRVDTPLARFYWEPRLFPLPAWYTLELGGPSSIDWDWTDVDDEPQVLAARLPASP